MFEMLPKHLPKTPRAPKMKHGFFSALGPLGLWQAIQQNRAEQAMAQVRYMNEVMSERMRSVHGAMSIRQKNGVFTICAKTRIPEVKR